jgi:hypothetical protein
MGGGRTSILVGDADRGHALGAARTGAQINFGMASSVVKGRSPLSTSSTNSSTALGSNVPTCMANFIRRGLNATTLCRASGVASSALPCSQTGAVGKCSNPYQSSMRAHLALGPADVNAEGSRQMHLLLYVRPAVMHARVGCGCGCCALLALPQLGFGRHLLQQLHRLRPQPLAHHGDDAQRSALPAQPPPNIPSALQGADGKREQLAGCPPVWLAASGRPVGHWNAPPDIHAQSCPCAAVTPARRPPRRLPRPSSSPTPPAWTATQ